MCVDLDLAVLLESILQPRSKSIFTRGVTRFDPANSCYLSLCLSLSLSRSLFLSCLTIYRIACYDPEPQDRLYRKSCLFLFLPLTCSLFFSLFHLFLCVSLSVVSSWDSQKRVPLAFRTSIAACRSQRKTHRQHRYLRVQQTRVFTRLRSRIEFTEDRNISPFYTLLISMGINRYAEQTKTI